MTIQQLEGDDWGDPEPDASSLVKRCTRLRRKPLAEFTADDLRVMLGQHIASGRQFTKPEPMVVPENVVSSG